MEYILVDIILLCYTHTNIYYIYIYNIHYLKSILGKSILGITQGAQ